MDVWVERLVEHFGITAAQASSLVKAGYITPKHVARAKDAKLKEVDGISAAIVKKLRKQ